MDAVDKKILQLLAANGCTSAADLCYFTGVSMATLRAMEKSGMVAFSEEEMAQLDELYGVTIGLTEETTTTS